MTWFVDKTSGYAANSAAQCRWHTYWTIRWQTNSRSVRLRTGQLME